MAFHFLCSCHKVCQFSFLREINSASAVNIFKNVLTQKQATALFSQNSNTASKCPIIHLHQLYKPQLKFSSNNLKICNNNQLLSQSVRTFRRVESVAEKQQVLLNGSIRHFRTSSTKNALPPLVIIVLGRLAKFAAIFAGRFARRWWIKLPADQKQNLSGRAKKYRYILWGLLGGSAFGAFVYYDTHIQKTPFTDRKRFVAFKDDQFNEIVKHQLELLLEEHKADIIPATVGQPMYHRVVRVAQRLLTGNLDLPQIHDKEWTITVVKDDNMMNAFVLPCGSIFVYSGLFKLCETDDQLGVILGHEMAHAVLGHGAEQASYLHLLDLLFILPVAALWAIIPSDAIAALLHYFIGNISEIMLSLPYNRSLEIEADVVGLVLAAKACFDIREAPVVWAKMAVWSKTEGEPDIEWLSTHPSHENRQNQLEELIPAAIKTRDDCKCPKLPFMDPRNEIVELKKKEKALDRKQILVPLKISQKL